MTQPNRPNQGAPRGSNRYKVDKRQWVKWAPLARMVFNETYGFALKNQRLFTHPDAEPLPKEYFKTIAWNVAFYAACMFSDEVRTTKRARRFDAQLALSALVRLAACVPQHQWARNRQLRPVYTRVVRQLRGLGAIRGLGAV